MKPVIESSGSRRETASRSLAYLTEIDQERVAAYICATAGSAARQNCAVSPSEIGPWATGMGVAPATGMVVSFFGTKGGTGTTTLAVNAAADVRRLTGRSALIVDLKMGPGDVSLFLGLRPHHSLLTAIDRVSWRDPGDMARLMTTHTCGLHVLASGDEFGRPGSRDAEAVEEVVRCLSGLFDVVVIDAGSTLTACSAV